MSVIRTYLGDILLWGTAPEPSVEPVDPSVTPDPSVEPDDPSVTPDPSVEPVDPSVTPDPSVEPDDPSVTPDPSVEPAVDVSYITFVDPSVAEICIAHYDTNGSGTVSYAEAAAVTSLNPLNWMRPHFADSSIQTFDELQYFTGLTSIKNHSFYDNKTLRSVVIPDTVTSIERYAFAGCSNLESVTLPSGLTSIGEGAFYNCEKLSIVIPASVIQYSDDALSLGPDGSVYIMSTTPVELPLYHNTSNDSYYPRVFGFHPTLGCTIYVPASALQAYLDASTWSYYSARIQAIPE